MAFKKDLTPLTPRGAVTVNAGKGGRQQVRGFGGHESLTGPKMGSMYPKPAPAPPPQDSPMTPSAPIPMSGGMGPAPPMDDSM